MQGSTGQGKGDWVTSIRSWSRSGRWGQTVRGRKIAQENNVDNVKSKLRMSCNQSHHQVGDGFQGTKSLNKKIIIERECDLRMSRFSSVSWVDWRNKCNHQSTASFFFSLVNSGTAFLCLHFLHYKTYQLSIGKWQNVSQIVVIMWSFKADWGVAYGMDAKSSSNLWG